MALKERIHAKDSLLLKRLLKYISCYLFVYLQVKKIVFKTFLSVSRKNYKKWFNSDNCTHNFEQPYFIDIGFKCATVVIACSQMPSNRLSEDSLGTALRMLRNGSSQREVARTFNVSHSVISRALQRFNTTGSVRFRHSGGRPRRTTPAQSHYIHITARRNPTYSATQINNALRAATGTVISSRTVRRRLREYNLRARRRARCPALNRDHRAARREWAREHLDWGLDEWRRCLFSDESRFRLHHSDGRVLVWRRPGERFDDRNIAPNIAFGGGSITVWGGIIFNGRTELIIFIRESVTAQRYRDRCILPVVVPFAENYGQDLIFMDDNARPHRAAIVNETLQAHNIERMVWPPCSPDANPIEHVWDRLQRQLSRRMHYPNTLNELAIALEEEWQLIPREYINGLVESMPNRCLAIWRARGGNTRY